MDKPKSNAEVLMRMSSQAGDAIHGDMDDETARYQDMKATLLFIAGCICQEMAETRAVMEQKLKEKATEPTAFVDIMFDGPAHKINSHFVEVENDQGASIKIGEWVKRGDGYWVLRIPTAQLALAPA